MALLERATMLALSLVVTTAGTMVAQDAPSPSPPASASADPEATAAPPIEALGGSWRRTAAAPFGAVDVPGGWTGTELVIVDPQDKRRATSYLPALDAWSSVARPPRKLLAGSAAHWTGTELLFVEPRGAARRGLVGYDPVADTWRTTAPAPFNEIGAAAWGGGLLVASTPTADRLASYDPATDAWASLAAPADATLLSLHSTGDSVLALTGFEGSGEIAFAALDLASGEWGQPAVGPLTVASAPPLWIGDRFVSLTAPRGPMVQEPPDPSTLPQGAPAVHAAFDPVTSTWTALENACDIDTSGAIWAEPSILDLDRQRGLDPATGQCFALPASPWAERAGAFRTWTGNELLEVSGTSPGAKVRRDAVAYDPYPGDDPLGIALDRGARPVRVRVPSLDIDLSVIWDGRKVAGSSPGYPACDVALTWSAFDLPGEPGTAWILAHAQPGMFLPLLETLRDKGKPGLLGREVEVQLRDGRLLTYRTYRVDPLATNTAIGTRGRKDDEHRLVLQTSTGVGTAPKLLVAARLVDVETTDEPRPKPRPRACG